MYPHNLGAQLVFFFFNKSIFDAVLTGPGDNSDIKKRMEAVSPYHPWVLLATVPILTFLSPCSYS